MIGGKELRHLKLYTIFAFLSSSEIIKEIDLILLNKLFRFVTTQITNRIFDEYKAGFLKIKN